VWANVLRLKTPRPEQDFPTSSTLAERGVPRFLCNHVTNSMRRPTALLSSCQLVLPK